MITHTISFIELVWTVFCSIGLLFSVKLLRRAVDDLKLLRRAEVNHFREFSAVTSVWIFGLLTYMQFTFVMVGVIAMTQPSPNNVVSPLSYFIGGVFLQSSFNFDVVAYILNKRKEDLIAMIQKDILAGNLEAYGYKPA